MQMTLHLHSRHFQRVQKFHTDDALLPSLWLVMQRRKSGTPVASRNVGCFLRLYTFLQSSTSRPFLPSILRYDLHYGAITLNRPLPSSKKPHFQNEAKCETFVVKINFICIIIENHFHINGFALSLALKVRFFGTRKWPIAMILYF